MKYFLWSFKNKIQNLFFELSFLTKCQTVCCNLLKLNFNNDYILSKKLLLNLWVLYFVTNIWEYYI